VINLSDEILNKYLDGELNESEASEVRSVLASSEELRKKFIALKLVHENLFLIEEEKVSGSFTDKVMKGISEKFVMPRQQKYFIISITTIIVVVCLVIFGYTLTAILSSASSGAGSQNTLDGINILANDLVLFVEKLFSGKALSIIGSIFSLIIIISGYFFFETQKRTKTTLGN